MPKTIPLGPPAPTASAVKAHRRALELSLEALRTGAAELTLASARRKAGAQDALAALYLKIKTTEFEIDCNYLAYELATQEDAATEVAWRDAIQTMEPEQIVEGISKELCCARCLPGTQGGCVITASAPYAGSTCGHPILQKHLMHLDDKGRPFFAYGGYPQAKKLFDAACEKLNVRKDFAA